MFAAAARSMRAMSKSLVSLPKSKSLLGQINPRSDACATQSVNLSFHSGFLMIASQKQIATLSGHFAAYMIDFPRIWWLIFSGKASRSNA